MTLDKLNYLIILAEEQNVTRAAQRLFITQPTLTSFINKLEKQLGFKLFDRSRNPVTLTRSGKQYIEQMRRLLGEEIQLVEDIRKQERARQTIRIGIGYIHSQLWMPQLVHALLKKYPDMNVQIVEFQEMRLMELLRNDELDLVFGHMEIDTVNFEFEVMCNEALSLVIPENLLPESLLQSTPQVLQENTPENPIMVEPWMLNDLPLIQPSETQGLFLNLKQLLEQYQIHPAQTIQTANMLSAASMVQLGLGYMYLSPVLLAHSPVPNPKKLYYCSLPHLIQTRKYYIGYKRDNPNLKIIGYIREIMKEIV